jgi:hypothetical protein
LSLAHVLTDEAERLRVFKDGLGLLRSSDALKRREMVTRLIALAWAIIAAHESGESSLVREYWQKLLLESSRVRTVADRNPVFFSPITKRQVLFGTLKKSLQEFAPSEVK